MKVNLRKTRLLATWLLVVTIIVSCNLPTSTATAIPVATLPVTQTFVPAPPLEGWITVRSFATEAQPVQKINATNAWVQTELSDSIRFSSWLQVKLAMQSNGVNGILLTATRRGSFFLGEPWWRGHKRFEILYESGFLNVLLRDGSQEAPIYLSQVQLEPGDSQVLVILDQQGKSIEIQHSGKTVMQISTQTVGDFPNGLFPEGQILGVELINGPNSGCVLTQLEFLVPTSENVSPTP